MIEFDFGDAIEVRYAGKPALVKSPKAVVVGPQTFRRVEMRLRGVLESFVVMFQPGGLHWLFSIPMAELTNLDYEAHAVLGSFASHAWQRLAEGKSFTERVRIVEGELLRRSLPTKRTDNISAVAYRMMLAGGQVQLPALAQATGLGTRQFERRFVTEVGMRPKLFARIARFEAALDYKARFKETSWTSVAHHFSYYDQMHMIHDFGEFTGGTPTKVLDEFETVYGNLIKTMRSGNRLKTPHADSRLIL